MGLGAEEVSDAVGVGVKGREVKAFACLSVCLYRPGSGSGGESRCRDLGGGFLDS